MVELAEKLKGLGPFFIAFVGDIDAGLDAPEKIGAKGNIALTGVLIGNVTHHLIDAENFLNNDNARKGAAACGRFGQIA